MISYANYIFYIGIGLWLLLMIFFYEAFDKGYKISYKKKYCENAPSAYPPVVAAYILKFGVLSHIDMLLVLIYLEYKKAVLFEEIDREHIDVFGEKTWKDILITKNNDSDYEYLPSEKFLLDWLIVNAGNGSSFSFVSFMERLKNADFNHKFNIMFTCWKAYAVRDSFAYGFLKLTRAVAVFGILAGVSYLLTGAYMIAYYELVKFLIFAFLGILMILYVKGLKKRTRAGQKEYEKLMAYKRYIKSIDTYNTLDYIYAGLFSIHIKDGKYNLFMELAEPLMQHQKIVL